jgi:hypothetical protein
MTALGILILIIIGREQISVGHVASAVTWRSRIKSLSQQPSDT